MAISKTQNVLDLGKCRHRVRQATRPEAKQDCCGDRYESNIAYVCACGEKGCESCMSCHLFEVHGIEVGS